MSESESSGQYEENSLSLIGSVAMGTGVMIGAGLSADGPGAQGRLFEDDAGTDCRARDVRGLAEQGGKTP